MTATFRQSMAGLHTWAGVIIGSLLFAIFWMGTLSVFDREIDRWMMPGTRLQASVLDQPIKLDGAITAQTLRLTQGSQQWVMRMPNPRTPAVELRWRNTSGDNERRYLHPQTGEVLAHTDTLAGTGFIFPFHYSLHLKWKDLGYWLVGLAGMGMLVMLVSGVIMHRKIFADFFLFRPQKHVQRASLDLHNLMGVLALPFHFVIALSGLIIFMSIYWPGTVLGVYHGEKDPAKAFSAEAYGQYRRPKADAASQPGQALASLDAMRAKAEEKWQGGQANYIRVWHPGDTNSYVELRRSYDDAVTMNLDQLYVDAASGAVLKQFKAAPVMTVQRFISGLHFVQFEHGVLRWLYFFAGLSGCIMIATGFVFWLESRRARHAKNGLAGVRVVEALAVFSVPGLMIATAGFLIVNRLLPQGAVAAGTPRAALEVWCFYLIWLATLAHAALRARAAWREQAWALAALALAALLLNWATTGHHLAYTLTQGLWAVTGVDMALLAVAALAVVCARRLPAGTPAAHSPSLGLAKLPVPGVGHV